MATIFLVPDSKVPKQTKEPIDGAGTATFFAALASLLLGRLRGPTFGWPAVVDGRDLAHCRRSDGIGTRRTQDAHTALRISPTPGWGLLRPADPVTLPNRWRG